MAIQKPFPLTFSAQNGILQNSPKPNFTKVATNLVRLYLSLPNPYQVGRIVYSIHILNFMPIGQAVRPLSC